VAAGEGACGAGQAAGPLVNAILCDGQGFVDEVHLFREEEALHPHAQEDDLGKHIFFNLAV